MESQPASRGRLEITAAGRAARDASARLTKEATRRPTVVRSYGAVSRHAPERSDLRGLEEGDGLPELFAKLDLLGDPVAVLPAF